MTLISTNFEDGTNGSAPAVAPGPGSWTVVSGTGTTYSTAAAFDGSLGMRFVTASSANAYVSWQNIAGATQSGAFRAYYRPVSTIGGVDQPLAYFRSTGGGTGLFTILLANNGNLKVNSDAGGLVATLASTVVVGTFYRIEFQYTNATTTTGTAALQVFNGDSTTPLWSNSWSALNLGTSTVGTVRFGHPSALGGAYTCDWDDVAFQTGSATVIGPASRSLNKFKIGDITASKLYVGTTAASKAYVGTTQIFP